MERRRGSGSTGAEHGVGLLTKGSTMGSTKGSRPHASARAVRHKTYESSLSFRPVMTLWPS